VLQRLCRIGVGRACSGPAIVCGCRRGLSLIIKMAAMRCSMPRVAAFAGARPALAPARAVLLAPVLSRRGAVQVVSFAHCMLRLWALALHPKSLQLADCMRGCRSLLPSLCTPAPFEQLERHCMPMSGPILIHQLIIWNLCSLRKILSSFGGL
jgi:hypothetical protein